MTTSDNTRHIILSPHFDDAVFSLGAFISRQRDNVDVVTVFAGIPEATQRTFWDWLCGFSDSTEAVTTRIEENQTALNSLGVPASSIINWSYLDAQYRVKETHLSTQVKKSIQTLVDLYSGEQVRLYAPLCSTHPDHGCLREALLMLLGEYPGIDIYLYQDMPYTFFRYLRQRVLHWTKAASFIINHIASDIFAGNDYVLERELVEVDTKSHEEKLLASKQYRSQVRGVNKYFLFAIRRFSKKQAKVLHMASPYCECVYKISRPM